MSKYANMVCPACSLKFKDGDDVVVCPVCGAPHHRSCYQKLGHCALEEHHGEDYSWRPAEKSGPDIPFDGDDALKCPRCNAINPADGIFCNICGARLKLSEMREPGAVPPNMGPPPIPLNPFTTPFGGVDPEEELDGVLVKDLALYVGESSYYFLPRFRDIAQGKRSLQWNWPSFFFRGFYFLYRKMYLIAAILIAASLVLSIPSLIFMKDYMPYVMENLNNPYPPVFDSSPYQNLISLNYAFSLINTFLVVAFSAFANRIYYRHCIKKVKKIKSQQFVSEQEYAVALSKKGRTNVKLIFFLVVGYFLLSVAVSFLVLLY
ncbi:MAG: RING finger protein [Oscillospiraceae bacterium]|nr:DUF2628 domain-containing protein [Oscillospiraceae bacterium]MDY4191449.1 RING finger protein [Oscillospiraceae bacterium]